MAHQPKIDHQARSLDNTVPPVHNGPPARRAEPSQPARAQPAPGGSRFHDFFRHFAHKTSSSVGSPWAFVLALTTILVWAVTGPLFHFSDTWQLVINTGTTIVTFLMVFLIQNTQNRDAVAIHLKLDELIRALKGARNQLVDLEELSDEQLEQLRREFQRLGAGHLPTHPYASEERS
jgi:low affinity Fe/Cu permease